MMKSLSDFQTCGFDADEIVRFLARHGINIGEPSAASSPVADETFPDWKRVMSLLPALTDTEAASAFAGIDLGVGGWLSDEEQTELSRWQSVVQRAICADELKATAVDFEQDGSPKKWSIAFADLAAWCAAKGLDYPLPGYAQFPATDTGLRDALSWCERERAQWKAKAEALEAAGDQRQALQTEIDRLRGELSRQTNEVAALSAERDRLKADALAGKLKSTALKIIGGLTMTGHGMDIHADRLEGIAEMVKDLEMVGAGVTEKTLREWIKEAANVIERTPRPSRPARKPV